MAQELQGLLDRIQNDGIKKADSEKERIVSEAKAEADKLIKEANEKAESIQKKAEEDAAAIQSRAEAAIKQASRDILLALKDDLKKRLEKVVKAGVDGAMTPDFMKQIIIEMVKNYKGGDAASVKVLAGDSSAAELEKLCNGGLCADLKVNPVISVGDDFDSGLKIGFEGEDVFFDFTDEALTSLICAFIGPRLAALLEAKSE